MFNLTITYLDSTVEKLSTTESYVIHLLSKGLAFIDKITIERYSEQD